MTFQQFRRPILLPWLLLALAMIACARTSAEHATAVPARAGEHARGGVATVFTDTLLFKQLCIEADSGLTARTNRCTPRDQAATLRFKP